MHNNTVLQMTGLLGFEVDSILSNMKHIKWVVVNQFTTCPQRYQTFYSELCFSNFLDYRDKFVTGLYTAAC